MRIDMSKAVSAEIPRSKKLASCIVAASQVEFSLIQNYLIKRWIDNDAISMVYGDSNCGKSFFALDMAFHVAAGVRWQEQRVKQGKVLYVAAEGGRASASASRRSKRQSLSFTKRERITCSCCHYRSTCMPLKTQRPS